MIRLIQFLIFGHWHNWETFKEVPYREWDDEVGKGAPSRTATKYVCRCKGCGKIKSFIP